MSFDYSSLLSSGGGSGGGGGTSAQSRAEATVDYGYTDRRKDNPWPIVAVAGGALFVIVLILAVVMRK